MTTLEWIDFAPTFSDGKEKAQFLTRIEPLIKASKHDVSLRLKATDELREELGRPVALATVPITSRAACLVLADLIAHGWKCRIRNGLINIARPLEAAELIKERERVQHQLHVERNRQLHTEPVREFV